MTTPAELPASPAPDRARPLVAAEMPPFRALADLVREHAQQAPRRPALVQDEQVLDYGALDVRIDRVAATLQADGLRPGEAVAVCAATSIDYAVVFLGTLRAGGVVAPLPPGASAASLHAMIADCGAQLLFLDQPVADTLAGAEAMSSPVRIALDDSSAGMAFEDWLAPAGSRPVVVHPLPEWPFNIIYSSGTTGTPKGIVQSHGMRWIQVAHADAFGYGPDCVTLLSTPLYSNTTLVSFLPTIAQGGTVVLMAKFDVLEYLKLAGRWRVTHTMLVPVQYRRLMAHPEFDRFDLSSFVAKFCTSAPFHADLKADILRRWPGGLVEFYGMTEGGGSCMLVAHEHPDKLHTVGQPIEGHEIRLIDERGQPVATGEAGEVVGRSDAMMNGYHHQPGKTAEAEWIDPQGRRYIRTGDVGRFDADGFLILLDRRKDMIISGGFNVYPSDLEAVLRADARVGEAAVVGVPSDQWGETPVAFVVPTTGGLSGDATGAPADLAASIREKANAQLGKVQRIAEVRLVDRLPRSEIGKVLKRTLRDEWVARRGAG
jgi:acyl-CoA synthetase (AMP-forming)/AMP-acid ligase II